MLAIKKFKSKKIGFTLIEAVLVIAITVIVVPMILATFIIIQRSYFTVLKTNDARDFAYLNQRAIDNVLVNSTQAIITNDSSSAAGSVLRISDEVYLTIDGTDIFDYSFYTDEAGEPIWIVEIDFQAAPTTRSVNYDIKVIERTTNDVYYTLTGSTFMPNADSADILSAGDGHNSGVIFDRV